MLRETDRGRVADGVEEGLAGPECWMGHTDGMSTGRRVGGGGEKERFLRVLSLRTIVGVTRVDAT